MTYNPIPSYIENPIASIYGNGYVHVYVSIPAYKYMYTYMWIYETQVFLWWSL